MAPRRSTSRPISAALFLALALVLAFQSSGQSQAVGTPPNALPFSLGYTVTGDYVVASADLVPEPDAADGDVGYQTTTIHIGTATTRLVPANAEILAAFLYWETLAVDPVDLDAQFRGLPVSLVRVNEQALTGVYSPCWSQSGNKLYMMRADVLSLLPLQMDENGFPTGRRLVNDKDLVDAGMPAGHPVRLPEAGTGNQTPQSAGASLFLVYRDPAAPLRRIVVYDGLRILGQGETAVQRIRGFLQSSAVGVQSRLTQIMSRGQVDNTDLLTVTGAGTTTTAGDLFAGNLSPSSDRAWQSLTTTISPTMPGAAVPGELEYGEQVAMTYRYANTSYNGCHTWAAIAFSTTVQDADGDGLIDRLEAPAGAFSSVSEFKDPNGTPYPQLQNMGATLGAKDLFVEVNSMHANPGTLYGSAAHPFPLASQNPVGGVITDALGHDHKPTPAVLKLVGDALGRAGVVAHFDVGDPGAYHASGPAYASTAADAYIIGAGGASGSHPELATGGESILETPCVEGDPLCQFPAFPGTVSWKYQLQTIRDQLLDPTTGLRRLDPIRNNIFHYLLYAHARGIAKSVWPCLDATQTPPESGFPVDNPTNPTTVFPCASGGLTDNPNFHVPLGVSGVSDLPGFNSMVTLGFSRNFLGTEFFQASTTLHELGHSLELWHGGAPPVFSPSTRLGAPAGSVRVDIQPNCKPSYQSSMSYLHQLYGLIDDTGAANIDYSNTVLGTFGGLIDETTALGNQTLQTSDLSPRRYRVAWYSPIVPPTGGQPGNTPYLLEVPTAMKHCDGTPLLPSELDAAGNPLQPMGRLQTSSSTPLAIDWAGDAGLSSPLPSDLDVNFDGFKGSLQGINDVDRLRLDQIGGGQNAGGFSTGIAYVGTGLTVDGIPYLGGPQYIGGIPFGAGGTAYPGGGIAYGAGGLYIGGIAYGAGGIAFGAGGIAFGGGGIAFGSGGIAFGGAGLPIIDGVVVVDYYAGGIAYGAGGIAFGSGGIAFGSGGIAYGGGGIAFGSGGIVYPGGGIAFGSGGIAYGAGGIAFGGGGELSHDDIEALGHAPPTQVAVCVLGVTGVPLAEQCSVAPPAAPLRDRNLLTWSASTLDSPTGFRGFRVTGAGVTTFGTPLAVDAGPSDTSLIDQEELPNGTPFTYWMKGKYGSPITLLSEPSLPPVTVTAVNLAPTAMDEVPVVLNPLSLPATVTGAVLANDTDVDMGPNGKAQWTAALVFKAVDARCTVGVPSGLTFNSNGTYTYIPTYGSVTFCYKVNTGKWTDGVTNMSPDSNVALVTITVPDGTGPTVTGVTVSPAVIWSPNGKKVNVTISGTATDLGGSGVASISLNVEDEYNLDEPDKTYVVGTDVQLSSTGAFQIVVALTASRNGSDKDGRKYTLTLHATDGAGNVGAETAPVSVTAHDQSRK